MRARYGPTPIPLPPVVHHPSQIGRFALASRRAIAALGARRVIVSGRSTAGGAVSEYVPWKPTLRIDAEVHKVRFNLGTINGVVGTSWDEELTIADPEIANYVIATVNTANGEVTSFALSLTTTTPGSASISKDTPPSSVTICLGVIKDQVAKMIVRRNLNMDAVEAFRESKTATNPGEEPFSRWWRWRVMETDATPYGLG